MRLPVRKCADEGLKIGMNDKFGESGAAVALLHKYGLDAEGIYNKIKEWA